MGQLLPQKKTTEMEFLLLLHGTDLYDTSKARLLKGAMADAPGSFSAPRSAGRLTQSCTRWRGRVPTMLDNLRRLRRATATVLPNRNGCDSELARLYACAIGFRKPCARARLAKFVFWASSCAAHPAWGGLCAVCDDGIVPGHLLVKRDMRFFHRNRAGYGLTTGVTARSHRRALRASTQCGPSTAPTAFGLRLGPAFLPLIFYPPTHPARTGNCMRGCCVDFSVGCCAPGGDITT